MNTKPNLSFGDYLSLVDKAINGDETATCDLQTYCQAIGRDYDEEIEKWRWRCSPEFLNRVMQQHEDEMNDPVRQMICARMLQPEITNDPVLGAIFEMPAQELLETVRARVTNPSDRYRPSQERQKFLEMMKARLVGAINVSSAQPPQTSANSEQPMSVS